jgi:hypothetical protein
MIRMTKASILLGILLVIAFVVSVPGVLSADTAQNLSISVEPEKVYVEMSPEHLDTIVIDLENLGNNETMVFCEILKVSEGWKASISDSVVLAAGVGSKGKAYLTIEPPHGFGYHDDQGTVQVSFTPALFINPSIKGSESMLNIPVKSHGFFPPGVDIVLAIIVIMGIIIIVLVIRKRRK